MRNFVKIGFFLIGILNLQACLSAAIVGVAGAAVATKVVTDPRTMGTQIDDSTLEYRAYNALLKSKKFDSDYGIEVIVYEGVALLVGKVPSEELKNTAQDIIMGITGMKGVYNEIRVSNFKDKDNAHRDGFITTDVKLKLWRSDKVKATRIKVVTKNQEVFLMSKLTREQGQEAALLASQVVDVKKVIKVYSYID